jgi:hypothetical protein
MIDDAERVWLRERLRPVGREEHGAGEQDETAEMPELGGSRAQAILSRLTG